MRKQVRKSNKGEKMAAYRFWNEKENRHWTKKDFEASFDGSESMFDSCWDMMVTKYMKNGDIKTVEEVYYCLDEIVANLVNNPRSRFYIYG
jgi:flagellar basal body-associated protein FliL